MKNIDKTNDELLQELNALKLENDFLKALHFQDNRNSNRTESGYVGSEIKFESVLNNNSDTVVQNDEQNIRQMFEDYIRMYSSRDDRLTTYFSENFSGFTGGGDFLVKDKGEWIAITRQDFNQIKDPIRIEIKDLALQSLSNTIVVTTGFFTIHLPIKDHILSRETARLVLIFRKESEGWKISHSSISIPYHLVREGEIYPLNELVDRNNLLENLVEERTSQLSEANEKLYKTNLVLSKAIADHKQAELLIQQQNKQLQELNASKDKFFSIIAHDLKSPFLGFLNLTEIMATESQNFTISQFAEFSQALNDSAVNLFKLLENLLEWAIMQQGKISFNLQKLNLHRMVSQNISANLDRSKQKGISIVNQVNDSLNVSADEQMINTVLRNLISNAVKFTERDGKVIIQSKKTDADMLEVSISDTGIGMDEKIIQRLFKIEEKVGSKGTDNEPSTGLGLLLCKEFIEKNGGRIWVESKENVGSTFYFTLPKVD